MYEWHNTWEISIVEAGPYLEFNPPNLRHESPPQGRA